ADATGEEAAAAGARVIRHRSNMGKGAALATGFSDLLSRGAGAIVTLDADGQHDPAEIPRFLEAWRRGGADLIVGARAGALDGMSPLRRFGNRFSTRAVRFFGGPDLPDTQCGFRLYTRRFLEAVEFRRRAYDAEAEILMLARAGGFRVASVSVRCPDPDGRGTSHYRPWLDTYRMCRTVVLCSLFGGRNQLKLPVASHRTERTSGT
ncbi:MAG TPA: glycosyltransferase family 2 protein, partial [Candidatus Saccharimonadales bacterium]|nr:glycosyltransferase family 2 protein [Candidatus Saccharimonadales bacterium]